MKHAVIFTNRFGQFGYVVSGSDPSQCIIKGIALFATEYPNGTFWKVEAFPVQEENEITSQK